MATGRHDECRRGRDGGCSVETSHGGQLSVYVTTQPQSFGAGQIGAAKSREQRKTQIRVACAFLRSTTLSDEFLPLKSILLKRAPAKNDERGLSACHGSGTRPAHRCHAYQRNKHVSPSIRCLPAPSSPQQGQHHAPQRWRALRSARRGGRARRRRAAADAPSLRQGDAAVPPAGPGLRRVADERARVRRVLALQNASTADATKARSRAVAAAFRQHDADCGSTRVQVARLTVELEALAAHVAAHPKR